MDKILEMLGINKLDESDQETLKLELETIIETKASEKATEKESEIKDQIVEEMEKKFDDYKEDITSKFSNFLDDILEEEISIPENVLEYAKLGEEYKPLIDSFKTKLAIDEGILDDDVKNILKEAKEEIVSLTEKLDEKKSKELELSEKVTKIINQNHLLKKCDGLTPAQKEKVFNILEGASVEEIDKKFDIIVKINEKDDDDGDSDDDNDKDKDFETKECPECGTENPIDATKCKECGASLKTKTKTKNESKSYIDDTSSRVDENNPKNLWLKILRDKKI
jgi:ribosomal protein L40E